LATKQVLLRGPGFVLYLIAVGPVSDRSLRRREEAIEVITINTGFTHAVKSTDRSVAASCLLGFSNLGSGLSGIPAVGPAPAASLAGLRVRGRGQRPTQAPEAVAAAQVKAYAFAVSGAGARTQTMHHRMMWAFRGLEPWRDPA
jgi:hypothetical protein